MKQFEAYIYASALKKAEKHFAREASRGLEALGLLVGDVYCFKGKEFIVVEDYITGKNASTSFSTKFEKKAFSEMVEQLLKKHGDKIIVGWAHSHPSFGCFLSSTDIEAQKKFFPEDFHAALVIDPIRKEKKFFKLEGDEYREASFAVIEKKEKE